MQVVSTDPYVNPDSFHATEVEPDSFSVGNTIVAAFQVGRAQSGGASNIGWARSDDGGVNWVNGFLPGITVNAGGTYERVSDPVVAYDALHDVWMISTIGIELTGNPPVPNRVDVIVSRSTDAAMTWQNPVPVAVPAQTKFLDKNWTVCDNHPTSLFYGNCYTEYDIATGPPNQAVRMRTSTDGGLTWGPATGVDGHLLGVGGQPVVQPNGNVIVPIARTTPTSEPTVAMAAFRSTDGGQTWGDTVKIADVLTFAGRAFVRNAVIPNATIDDNGKVYVVWTDCRFEPDYTANDVVMSTSTNGVDWTPIRRVPVNRRGADRQHMVPAIEVQPGTTGAGARLAVLTYYFDAANCRTNQCWLHAAYLSSTNGGKSWSDKTRLGNRMRLPWLPVTSIGHMFGDYLAVSFAPDGMAVPVIPLAQPPVGSTMDVAMYSTRLNVTGGTLAPLPAEPISARTPGAPQAASPLT